MKQKEGKLVVASFLSKNYNKAKVSYAISLLNFELED